MTTTPEVKTWVCVTHGATRGVAKCCENAAGHYVTPAPTAREINLKIKEAILEYGRRCTMYGVYDEREFARAGRPNDATKYDQPDATSKDAARVQLEGLINTSQATDVRAFAAWLHKQIGEPGRLGMDETNLHTIQQWAEKFIAQEPIA